MSEQVIGGGGGGMLKNEVEAKPIRIQNKGNLLKILISNTISRHLLFRSK